MRRLPLLTVLLCAVTALAYAAEVPFPWLNDYLTIQTALSLDTLDGVQASAKAIASSTRKLGAQGAAAEAAALALASAADLKAARAAFGELSNAVIALSGTGHAGVKRAYCPMVKKYWLQKSDKIENPYYGSQMYRCGEFK
jgi:membrane fusion protein, copper/silver efflux system